MRRSCVEHGHDPTLLMEYNGMQNRTVGTGLATGAAGRMARLTSDHLGGSTLDFLLRFTPTPTGESAARVPGFRKRK